MTIGRLVALGGLFLAWWGFQQGDVRLLAWALVVVAVSPFVRPLLGLDGEAPDADASPAERADRSRAPERPAAETGGAMPASRQRFKR